MPQLHHRYQQELDSLAEHHQQMLVMAEGMVRDAMRSIVERDPALGRQVLASDSDLDRMEKLVDESCMRILALYRPVARDLRLVITLMKSATDLERIGDQAVNIAKRGFDLSRGTGLEPVAELAEMAELVGGMMATVREAFLTRELGGLERLAPAERRVDELNRAVFTLVINAMALHPDQSRRGLALTSVSKALERVADHAVNLEEQLIYLVRGEDVRHARED